MISISKFIALLKAQLGDRYVFGVETRVSDPDPSAFDCSEIIQWAAGRLGVSVPDGAINQYNWLRKKGLDLPVSKALKIPGALLFKEGTGRHARIYHVGVSLGNGDILEAKGRAYGVVISKKGSYSWADSPASGMNRWNLAGMLPGFDYGSKKNLIPLLILGAVLYKKRKELKKWLKRKKR
jgi:cell wall-associated NlpC family hydrolase